MTLEPHVRVTVTVTDRQGAVETVDAGTQPAWAWHDRPALEPWRRMMRRLILSGDYDGTYRTADPSGWRVTFTAAPEPDDDDTLVGSLSTDERITR